MGGLVKRVLHLLHDKRERILKGEINCIPSPFKAFDNSYPGIEQGKYYLVSGGAKAGKTQLANFLFLFTPILYAYLHPDKLRIKIFYFPLEETPEKITIRFMCHLLYTMSHGTIRIPPLQLQSIDEEHLVNEETLNILESTEYRKVLDFYESHVIFVTNERNPTGCWKTVSSYAKEAGTIHKKTVWINNPVTGVQMSKEVFDYYEPKDPEEYVEIIYDHASLVELERGLNLKQCIDKLSEYFMIFRNHYNYTPILIQQQNLESIGLDAVKENRIRPTLAGLADSKNPGKDCSVMIGITNPFAFEKEDYLKYNIKLLRSYARFVEIVLNRESDSNDIVAMYFDGAVNYFTPLPKSSDKEQLDKVYTLVERYSK